MNDALRATSSHTPFGDSPEVGRGDRRGPVPRPPIPLSDREILLARVIGAPRDVVFRACVEARHVVHWWGPFGFRTTVHEMNVRPGGLWRFTMHGPDGVDYANVIRFVEVVEPHRLAFRHGSGDGKEPDFDVELTFVPDDQGTRVALRQTHVNAARAAQVKRYAVDGGNQTLTRLAGYVGIMREGVASAVLEGIDEEGDEADLVYTREFEASREILFRALTEPADLGRWLGPPGQAARIVSSELRPGGQLRYAMKPGPSETHGRFLYREVVPPQRLAYVVSSTDARFVPSRHPASRTWPLEVLVLNALSELDGQAVLFSRSLPIAATEAEARTFQEGHAEMREALDALYRRLADYLKTAR